MFFKVVMKTIDGRNHRYPTIGDWRICRRIGKLVFKIVVCRELGITSAFLVMLHELIETFLCYRDGVTEQVVTDWDKCHLEADEPGEIDGCPYFQQHAIAMGMEKRMAQYLGMPWEVHEKKMNEVWDERYLK